MQSEGWIKQVVDGKTTMTYDANVNTVDEATKADYKGVEAVGATGVVVSQGVTYNLNENGSITNSDGNDVALDRDIKSENGFTVGGLLTTGGGTVIQTDNMAYTFKNLPMARGAISEDNTIANFFTGGIALKGAFGALFGSTSATGRVFWSGGAVAKNGAAEFAAANGMKTLEMTRAGGVMNTISPFMPRAVSNPIWNHLSANFARGASGEVNFFTTAVGPRPTSVWMTVENPILTKNAVNIITNIVK